MNRVAIKELYNEFCVPSKGPLARDGRSCPFQLLSVSHFSWFWVQFTLFPHQFAFCVSLHVFACTFLLTWIPNSSDWMLSLLMLPKPMHKVKTSADLVECQTFWEREKKTKGRTNQKISHKSGSCRASQVQSLLYLGRTGKEPCLKPWKTAAQTV